MKVRFARVVQGDSSFMKSSAKLQEKKVYEAPKFSRYGSLTELTAANHLRGMKDGKTGTTKTG
jgi:hypothetical protein